MNTKNSAACGEALDLTERETSVYLGLVRKGWGSAQEVAQDIGLPRTTVKSILDRLVERGLVAKEQRGDMALFTPEEPSTVLARENARVKALESALHHIQDQYFTSDRGVGVRVYDNPRSLQNLLVRAIADTPRGSTVCAFESPGAKNYEQVMSSELLNAVVSERAKKGIHMRLLVPLEDAKHIQENRFRSGITVRTLPANVHFTASYWIFDKSLVLFSGKQALAVEITHSEIYQSMQSVFDHLWEEGMHYTRP